MTAGQSRSGERATVIVSERCPRCGKNATVVGSTLSSSRPMYRSPVGTRTLRTFGTTVFQGLRLIVMVNLICVDNSVIGSLVRGEPRLAYNRLRRWHTGSSQRV